jgi:hypothetical protein
MFHKKLVKKQNKIILTIVIHKRIVKMYKNLIKIFFVCVSGCSVICATEQHLSPQPSLSTTNEVDSLFEQELNNILPVQIVDGERKLSEGDRFSVGNVALECVYDQKDNLYGLKIFVNDIYVLKSQLTCVLYPHNNGRYYGRFTSLINASVIPLKLVESVIKLFKKLFPNDGLGVSIHCHLDKNSQQEYEQEFTRIGFKEDIGTRVESGVDMIIGRYDILPNPFSPNSLPGTYLGLFYKDDQISIYNRTICGIKIHINDDIKKIYIQYIDYINCFLKDDQSDFAQFQTYQWSALTKSLQNILNDNSEIFSSEDHYNRFIINRFYHTFVHQTLYILQELGHTVNLEKGGIKTFIIPEYIQNGKTYPAKQVSFYAKGPFCLVRKECESDMLPDFFIDIRNQMNPREYIYQTHNTPNGVRHVIISDKGIEEGDFLVVKKEKNKTTGKDEKNVYHIGGMNASKPFSILAKQTLEDSINVDNFILPIPSDDTDLNVLSYLLSEIEKEEQEKNHQEILQNIEKTEELPDDNLTEEAKIDFERAQEAKKHEKIRKLELIKKEKEEGMRNREALFKEEAIKKIEEELFTKELYNQKVKKEQEARRLQVIKEAQRVEERNRAQKGKKGSKTVSLPSQNASASTIETEEQMRLRIRLQAEGIFNERCIKLKDVASRINSILKINPDARSILFRQSGSHLVADGASASSGPVTLVIPHGGDGTLLKRSVNNFFERFIHLILSRR